ncbi:MAG TPA: FtsX-like permease family protein [Mobilitalea sp.]|nr:FtsX-like permease family protein [Mobilitalea sp.]
MNLNKRIKRDIKYNISFYISASLLTAIAVLFVILTYTAVDMIDDGFNKLMVNRNVEDAQFTTFQPITEEDIKSIEETYKVELEAIRYVDSEEENYRLRSFAPTHKINVYELLEGEDIKAKDEILVNRDFALANKLDIGDSLSVKGKEYTITGLAVRPDYVYAIKEQTDIYVDDATFGQVTMSREAFDELEHIQSYYSIVYQEDNEVEVRQFIHNTYYCLSYIASESNNRISMARDLMGEFELILDAFMPIMFILIAFIVAVVLGRMVKREQKLIGTLVAMGYRKGELVRHYAIYAMLPGIIGSLLGILISIIFLKPLCILMAMDFEQINFVIKLHPISLLISIFVPTFLYLMTAVWMVRRLLKNNTVLLLAGNAGGDKKKSRFLANSKMSFRYKFQLRNLLANKSRTIVVISGMFIGGFMCAYGFIFMDSSNYLVDKGMDAAGSFEYQYFLNTVETIEPEEGEPMLSTKFEVPGKKGMITISGLVEKPKFLQLDTSEGEPIEYGKYYMTSNAAIQYGIEGGDEFTFMQVQTMKEFTVTIEAVIKDNTQSAVYTSIDNLATLLELPDSSYNVIMSDRVLPIDKDKIFMEYSKDKMKEQLERIVEIMYSVIYMLIILGGMLCIISVYLTVNMLVAENRSNISMLKVLGYRKKEINRLVLNTNHILLPISFGLSIFACLKLSEMMFKAFIAEFNMYFEPVITLPSLLICLAILTGSYFISLAMLKHKVYRVDMIESLKDNRE